MQIEVNRQGDGEKHEKNSYRSIMFRLVPRRSFFGLRKVWHAGTGSGTAV